MIDYKKYFKNKKITVMGLGLLGRGVGDAAFLAECGAKLLITDLKTKEQLKESLNKLKKYNPPAQAGNIKFVLGKHRLEDFRNKDFILKAAGVLIDSLYVKEARRHKIPIKMSASLFVKLADIPIVGVTGTRGKSTVTHLIAHILEQAGRKVLLGGNVRGVSTLQLLKKVTPEAIAVFELDSWQLQGFGDSKLSPNISVFTTFMDDHLNYYASTPLDSTRSRSLITSRKKYFVDKANIFKYQKKGDVFIAGPKVAALVKNEKRKIKSRFLMPKPVPKSWKLKIPGEHNRENAALAAEAARAIKIPGKIIRRAVENFKGVPGRLELVREIKGVKIYNDNNSTTPDATIAGLRALGPNSGRPMSRIKKRRTILIMGGDDKNLDMSKLIKEIPKYCSKVVLFKERGTDRVRDEIFAKKKSEVSVYEEEGLSACVARAFSIAKSGEIILYSPAFSSFGKYFKNEYDRGDQFVKLVKKLK